MISDQAWPYITGLYQKCDITVVILQCDIIHQTIVSHPNTWPKVPDAQWLLPAWAWYRPGGLDGVHCLSMPLAVPLAVTHGGRAPGPQACPASHSPGPEGHAVTRTRRSRRYLDSHAVTWAVTPWLGLSRSRFRVPQAAGRPVTALARCQSHLESR